MWVKICANTNLEDTLRAAELGADAVGFVFASGKRQVTVEQVAAIVPHLPDSLEKIGVFTTHDAKEIFGIACATGLTGVQLHGGFDLELARSLRARLGRGVTIVQTAHWIVEEEPGDASEIATQLGESAKEPAIDRVLVDSKTRNAIGGSGIRFDWSAARATFSNAVGMKLIVAGGLTPGNVAEAIEALEPWGVDVASGVEAKPGRKDPEKLRKFIENARRK